LLEKVDIAIVGAGVIGLAIALEVAKQTKKTVAVLEKNQKFGQEISSRNSEVIHSGIYYPEYMLKTRLCIEGNALLYDFCNTYRISHNRIGKLIIASDGYDVEKLQLLIERADMYNLNFRELGKQDLNQREPLVNAELAVYLPDTGIIDSYEYMQALYYLGKENQVIYLLNTVLQGIEYDGKSYILETPIEKIKADLLVNATGLASDRIPDMLGLNIDDLGYRLHPCKGEYFKINKRLPIKHLIYPLPGQYGLGIHLTIDVNGGLRLGPNAHYIEKIDYSVSEDRLEEFYQAASRYLPFLTKEDLAPDFAGIRPKLQRPGEKETHDFVIQEESINGFAGLINLIGIESPGLTSSLAIGKYVTKIIKDLI